MRKSIVRKRLVLLSLSLVLVGVLGAAPVANGSVKAKGASRGPGEQGEHDHRSVARRRSLDPRPPAARRAARC